MKIRSLVLSMLVLLSILLVSGCLSAGTFKDEAVGPNSRVNRRGFFLNGIKSPDFVNTGNDTVGEQPLVYHPPGTSYYQTVPAYQNQPIAGMPRNIYQDGKGNYFLVTPSAGGGYTLQPYSVPANVRMVVIEGGAPITVTQPASPP